MGHILSECLCKRDIFFIVVFHFLSLRQKSKIFVTSLVRGRLWCGAKPHRMHHSEWCIEVRPYLFGKLEFEFKTHILFHVKVKVRPLIPHIKL